jgi:hypothetical protein
MNPPDLLALDFDGVLCDGMREYFETSRRTYARVWPGDPVPGAERYAAFEALRPVIMTGWEMPLLLRALAKGSGEAVILGEWEVVRDALVRQEQGTAGAAADLAARLVHALDDVRREWIAADPESWLGLNVPYASIDELRRLVAEPERAVLVTTKEGEFAKRLLDHWGLRLASIQGKEAGTHKCDNLRELIGAFAAVPGRRPRLWFVEDRLETLQHVTGHPDLDDVGLFLSTWGYNTEAARDAARADPRIRLLDLETFRRGLTAWC